MAVTNAGIGYAQAFTTAGADENLSGFLQYRKNGDLKLYFPQGMTRKTMKTLSASDYSTHTQYTVGNRVPVTEYANGDRLYYVEWITYDEPSGLYRYNIAFDITNSGGQTLYHDEHSSRNLEWYTGEEGFYNVYLVWYPTATLYPNDPITTNAPDNIFPYGYFAVARTDEPLSLDGELSRSTVYQSWEFLPVNYSLNNDQDYTNYINGDGIGSGGDIIPKKPEDDHSTAGGGGGAYRPGTTGDKISIGGLPSTDASATGLLTLYNPSLGDIQELSDFLWSDDFIDNIKKLKNDPFESVISLSLIPFNPNSMGSMICNVGNVSTGISMKICSQYKQIQFGSFYISEFWGSFMDYAPYTKIEIYLPFVGVKTLNTDDVMGKTVSVTYNLDCLSGAGLCTVTVDGSALYQFDCNTASHIPLTGSNKSQQLQALAGFVTATGAGIAALATGGATAPAAGAIAYSATRLATVKDRTVQRSGAMSCEYGVLGVFDPYIIIHRPVQSLPANYGHFKGYMSNITGTIGSFSGYLEVEYAHLDGVTATDTEKEELERILQSGIIV